MKLVYLVGFIIRIHNDARSPERQIKRVIVCLLSAVEQTHQILKIGHFYIQYFFLNPESYLLIFNYIKKVL